MSLIRQLLESLGYPQSRALGFPQMGLAIEGRHRRLSQFWTPHLERSKKVQERWAEETLRLARMGGEFTPANEELVVLGAGRLFDFNLKELSRRFGRLHFVDGDPLCRPYWKRAVTSCPGTAVDWEIVDISGMLANWKATLEQSSKLTTWEDALNEIRHLPELESSKSIHACPGLQEGSAKAVVSLNLLSQIPIVWQDCVERILRKHFSARFLREHQDEWLQAFFPGAALLVRRHLQGLAASGAEAILLITDLEYAYYSGPRRYSSRSHDALPVRWMRAGYDLDLGGYWVENKSTAPAKRRTHVPTTCEVLHALYGVDLETEESRLELLPDYRSSYVDSWLWHIQPQGIEDKKRGTIHRVGAFMFFKEAYSEHALAASPM